MPIYEYACCNCGKHFEYMQKITDDPLTTCPSCQGRVKKLVSNCSFQLKGTGWYVTDYARKPDNSRGKLSERKESKKESTSGNGKGKGDVKGKGARQGSAVNQ